MTDLTPMFLADYIHELADQHRQTTQPEPTAAGWTRHHTITVPSLLDQLWSGATSTPTDTADGHTGYASRPAAHLDSLDTATAITRDVADWLTDLGHHPLRNDPAANLHRLHTLSTTLPRKRRAQLEGDARRWWLRARIVTGWDTPPWSPDATCPACGERGTLRIRFADGLALCTAEGCDSTWDRLTIGILAEHIRGQEARTRSAGRGPCWCPVPPPPDAGGVGALCPACGSARCRHAARAVRRAVAV